MASIKCGHCPETHDSVDRVRDCWELSNVPMEICCGSCDALLGYAEPDEDYNFPEYCGGQWCKRFPPM